MDDRPTALILIDLQNEFLVEGGAFLRRHVETSALVDAVRWSVELARQQGRWVVWVESIYGELEATVGAAALQGQTHLGAPCCVRGSWGAEPVAGLAAIAAEAGAGRAQEVRLTKQYYCAFQQTELHGWLRARGVRRLALAGVATNICVTHTAREARRLGYEVTILSDATAAASLSRHLAALAELGRAGCAVQRWAELGSECGPVTLRGLGSGSALHINRLSSVRLPSTGAGALAALTAEVDWQTMSHRGGEVPRLVATQGDLSGIGGARIEPLYRHPADEYPPVRPWTPQVTRLRDEVSALIGHPFNHCLIQLYRDGQDWIGAHSDKTLDVVSGSSIINVSVGALRTMVLRRKQRDAAAPGEPSPRETQRIPLPHGSVMQMSLVTNRDWLHEIRQQGASGEVGPRISLTFRWIGTFWNTATGAVWGEGAPYDQREDAEEAAVSRARWSEEQRLRWELAESEQMLKLFRQENQSASFERTEYHPGFELVHLRHFQEHAAAASPPAPEGPGGDERSEGPGGEEGPEER